MKLLIKTQYTIIDNEIIDKKLNIPLLTMELLIKTQYAIVDNEIIDKNSIYHY